MQRFRDSILVNGFNGLQPLPNAQVTVYEAGTFTLATLYSTNAKASQQNPFRSDSYGVCAFYAQDGRYDIKVESLGVAAWVRDVLLEDDATEVAQALQVSQEALDIANDSQGRAQLAASLAEGYAETAHMDAQVAEAAAGTSSNDAGLANAAAISAENDADRAEAARDAATVGADLYPDEATGRAAVADGEYFKTVSADPNVAAELYQRIDENTSEPVTQYPSGEGVSRLPRAAALRKDGPNIYRWAELDFTDFSRVRRVSASENLAQADYQGVLAGKVVVPSGSIQGISRYQINRSEIAETATKVSFSVNILSLPSVTPEGLSRIIVAQTGATGDLGVAQTLNLPQSISAPTTFSLAGIPIHPDATRFDIQIITHAGQVGNARDLYFRDQLLAAGDNPIYRDPPLLNQPQIDQVKQEVGYDPIAFTQLENDVTATQGEVGRVQDSVNASDSRISALEFGSQESAFDPSTLPAPALRRVAVVTDDDGSTLAYADGQDWRAVSGAVMDLAESASESLLRQTGGIRSMYVSQSGLNLTVGQLYRDGTGVEYEMHTTTDGLYLCGGGRVNTVTDSPPPLQGEGHDPTVFRSITVRSAVNSYTEILGGGWDAVFNGIGFFYQSLTNNRGGVWKFVIDEGTPDERQFLHSTYAEAETTVTTLIVSDLKNGPHTLRTEFMGDDPDHPPIGGASRGWFKYKGVFTLFDADPSAISEMVTTGGVYPLTNKSIFEGPISITAPGSSGSAEWVPAHGGKNGVNRNIARRIYADGVLRADIPNTGIKAGRIVIEQLSDCYSYSDNTLQFKQAMRHIFDAHGMRIELEFDFVVDTYVDVGYPAASLAAPLSVVDTLTLTSGEVYPVAPPPGGGSVSTYLIETPYGATYSGPGGRVAIAQISALGSLREADTSQNKASMVLTVRDDDVTKLYWRKFFRDTVPAGTTLSFATQYCSAMPA